MEKITSGLSKTTRRLHGRTACAISERNQRPYSSKFLFTEALRGWRRGSVRERITCIDWAHEIRYLLEKYVPAEKIILIMDNLNTHSVGSLYKAFEPAEARQLAKRLEIHYTQKHGSWLTVAKCVLSAFTRQCLSRRMPDRETLQQEAGAWMRRRNESQKGVDWHFTTKEAQIRLKRLYQKNSNLTDHLFCKKYYPKKRLS